MPKRRSQKPATKKASKPAHRWRPCPLGEHWVTAHPRNQVSPKGRRFPQSVSGHCRTNSSHVDRLYRDDIHEIAARHFSKLKGLPTVTLKKFKAKGNTYDSLIRGWTRYWNEVLNPADQLDPDTIKALIATESSFNPTEWNEIRGSGSAHGLMQVTKKSVQLLNSPVELSDHFIELDNDDMLDPNLSICAGIRWLFRKKQIAQSRSKTPVSWRDAIMLYKDAKTGDQLMKRFDDAYNELKGII